MNKVKEADNSITKKSGWKILFEKLFVYKRDVVILSFLGVVSALANGSTPYIIGKFFDALVKPAQVPIFGHALPLWFVLMALFVVVQIVADTIDWRHSAKRMYMGNVIFASYRAETASALLYLPLAFHKNRKLGEIQETMSRAANGVSNIIQNIVINLFPQFLSVFIGFIVGLYINPFLAFILLCGVVLYVVVLYLITKDIGELVRKGNRAWGKAHNVQHEALANVDLVKRFTTEQYEQKKIHRMYVEKAAKKWTEADYVWNDVDFYQRIIVTVTRGAIFLVSVYFISNNSITIGELIAFNGYAMMFFGPFATLGYNWQSVQNGIVALEEMDAILRTVPEVYHPKDAQSARVNIEGAVSFHNVCFTYPGNKKDTLQDISFDIKKGETVALVGESGVGKSTLIDLLLGFYFPRTGNVYIDGVDIRNIPLHDLRGAIAMVPQEITLFNDTVIKNIKYGNFDATEEEIKEVAQKAHADAFIEKFPEKYKQIVGERGIKLSVGQKQRIAIARALLRDPKILILDEPTSALDSQTERLITESLDKLMEGRTTFIIAHRLSTVRKADKILVFEDGRIVESGTHEELIQKEGGVYHRLHDLHIGLK